MPQTFFIARNHVSKSQESNRTPKDYARNPQDITEIHSERGFPRSFKNFKDPARNLKKDQSIRRNQDCTCTSLLRILKIPPKIHNIQLVNFIECPSFRGMKEVL